MMVKSSLGISFMEEGYDSLPRINLPVPKDGETISLQKEYYAGTHKGKEYTIYIDRVFRNGDTYSVWFAKERGMEEATTAISPVVALEPEKSYAEFVEAYSGGSGDGLNGLKESSLRFRTGTLGELGNEGKSLPFVCTGISYDDMEKVAVKSY